MIELIHGDCLEVMKTIPDKSIDCIITDLPYGRTACKWDIVIPFDKLWEQYNRVIKDNGAIILFGRQPFSSALIMSNLKMFRYEIIWEKDKGTDFGNSNRKILNAHENILIFYKKQPTYNKQMQKGKPYKRLNYCKNNKGDINFASDNSGIFINNGERTPKSVIKIARDNITAGKNLHPTQKPVALLEYLIRTYTNEGETVLDNCMGSGSTGVACKNLNRKFIGIEKDEKYFELAKGRLNRCYN